PQWLDSLATASGRPTFSGVLPNVVVLDDSAHESNRAPVNPGLPRNTTPSRSPVAHVSVRRSPAPAEARCACAALHAVARRLYPCEEGITLITPAARTAVDGTIAAAMMPGTTLNAENLDELIFAHLRFDFVSLNARL